MLAGCVARLQALFPLFEFRLIATVDCFFACKLSSYRSMLQIIDSYLKKKKKGFISYSKSFWPVLNEGLRLQPPLLGAQRGRERRASGPR